MNQKWHHSLRDITAYCGAGVGSDHHLVLIVKVKRKQQKAYTKGKTKTKRQFDTTKLQY